MLRRAAARVMFFSSKSIKTSSSHRRSTRSLPFAQTICMSIRRKKHYFSVLVFATLWIENFNFRFCVFEAAQILARNSSLSTEMSQSLCKDLSLARFPKIRLGHLPTPLEPLDRLSEILGGPRLWVKRDDCKGLSSGGNKTRKLEFLMA